MESLFADLGTIFSALQTQDAWEISDAFNSNAVWLFGAIFTFVGAAIVMVLYRFIPFLDQYLESSIMIVSYLLIAVIIFVSVVARFGFNYSESWTATIPPYWFLVMTWVGCSLNVRKRSHLSFNEIRTNLPRFGQLICLTLDMILWCTFSWLVVTVSLRFTAKSASNYAMVIGTDDTMKWWFLIIVPISFTVMAARAIQVYIEDIQNYRSGKDMVFQAAIGSD